MKISNTIKLEVGLEVPAELAEQVAIVCVERPTALREHLEGCLAEYVQKTTMPREAKTRGLEQRKE